MTKSRGMRVLGGMPGREKDMFGSNARGFSPWFSVFQDDEGEGGSGGNEGDSDKGSDDGKSDEDGGKPNDVDVEAWMKEQTKEVRAALTAKFETDTAGLKSALAKERDAHTEADKLKAEIEKKKAEADDAALADGKKYEELATKRKDALDASTSEVAVLAAKSEKLEARAKKAEAAVEKNLAAQLAAMDLEPYVLALLEGKDPTDQLEFLAKYQEELGTQKAPRLPRSPDEKGNGSKMTEKERSEMTAKTWL